MIKIQHVMVNNEAGDPAWVEFENSGGELPLAPYWFKSVTLDGKEHIWWPGGSEEVLFGMGTLRLTDGSVKAEPVLFAEPRHVIRIPGMNFIPAKGGELVLSWLDADWNVKSDTLTLPADAPSGKALYRLGNDLVAPNTTLYHQVAVVR